MRVSRSHLRTGHCAVRRARTGFEDGVEGVAVWEEYSHPGVEEQNEKAEGKSKDNHDDFDDEGAIGDLLEHEGEGDGDGD